MEAWHGQGGDRIGAPRIVVDLAEGRLTRMEVEAVVTWLTAEGLQPVPQEAVRRAASVARWPARLPRPCSGCRRDARARTR